MIVSIERALLLASITRGIFAAPSVTGSGKSFSLPANLNEKYVRDWSRHGEKISNSPPANYHRGIYTTPAVIGGSQILNLQLDTSTADTWIFSTYLDPSLRGSHSIFDPAKSSTFALLEGYYFDAQYIDGNESSGKVGSDVVALGTISAPVQVFGVPDSVSAGFLQAPDDGKLGLAFIVLSSVTPHQAVPFLANVQSLLDSPVFAAYLPAGANGIFDFGTIPASRYTGTLQYARVNSLAGFWEFNSGGYRVGTHEYPTTGIVAIADIASPTILMQIDQTATYYAAVSNSEIDRNGVWTFPCDANLPTLGLKIGLSAYATIPTKYLILEATDNTRTRCIGSLQHTYGSYNICGVPFFNTYYGVFEASNPPRFGFAPCTGC